MQILRYFIPFQALELCVFVSAGDICGSESVFLDSSMSLISFVRLGKSFPSLISLSLRYDTSRQISFDLAQKFRNLREIALSSFAYPYILNFDVFEICNKLEKVSLLQFTLNESHRFSNLPKLTSVDLQWCQFDLEVLLRSLPLGLRQLSLSDAVAHRVGWNLDCAALISRFLDLRVLPWHIFDNHPIPVVVCVLGVSKVRNPVA